MSPRAASRRWSGPALAALVVLVGLACTSDPLTPPLLPVVEVVVTGAPADGVVILDYPHQLVAEARGPSGEVLAGRSVRWHSDATSVATVDADGVVSPVALGGVTVRATAEGIGRSVPLEVREGITVPTTGGTATAVLLDGLLRLSVPVGVAPAGSVIHARAATTWPADDRILAGTVVDLGPDGSELTSAITPSITFVPADVPAVDRPNLRLYAVGQGGGWAELPGGSVDLTNFRVSASLMRLAKLAIFRRAAATQLQKLAGDDQTVPRGTAVPIAPSVAVLDAAGRPVSGVTVTFATGPSGGQLTGNGNVVSGLDGVATIPGQWRMGSSAGTYTLIASIPGGISVTFTATATP